MKYTIFLSSMLLMSVLLFSCHKSNLTHEKDFEKSYNTWLDFKKKTGNSYRYMAVGGSWVGFGWQTIITVSAGRPIQRDFKYIIPAGYPDSLFTQPLQWTENESQLDTHTQTAAADVLTLDQIYEQARTEWLIKRSNATIDFEAKNNGMISLAGFAMNQCQDDCFRGIDIAYIEDLQGN